MKKLLTIVLSIISLTLMAQVPQGVGYQGVATDANGIELVNQSISIRASVLSGSATGTIEWEETHATSTDTFGLFTLTIGQGTSTGNGAQTSFANISAEGIMPMILSAFFSRLLSYPKYPFSVICFIQNLYHVQSTGREMFPGQRSGVSAINESIELLKSFIAF